MSPLQQPWVLARARKTEKSSGFRTFVTGSLQGKVRGATGLLSTAPGRIATGARADSNRSRIQGENYVTKVYLTLAATIAAASASPALASAVAPAAAPAPKAAAQAPKQLTRAGLTKNLDDTFKAIDTNGDGTLSQAEISAAEMKVLQNRASMARQRLEAEFTKLDTNKDGNLSKAEFMAAAPAGPTTAPNGAPALAQLDKNKDGKVSLDEYRAPQLAVFDKLDTNKDGTISQAERQAAARKK